MNWLKRKLGISNLEAAIAALDGRVAVLEEQVGVHNQANTKEVPNDGHQAFRTRRD